jgi:hypothetical protein
LSRGAEPGKLNRNPLFQSNFSPQQYKRTPHRWTHGDRSFEVSPMDRSDERIDHAPLVMQIGVCGRGFILDATSRAVRELTRRNGGAVHNRLDLIECHAERVVKTNASGSAGLQHNEEGESDRIGGGRDRIGRADSSGEAGRRRPDPPGRSTDQSGYSSFRQERGSAGWPFGVRSSRKLKYGATNGSGADTV